MSHAIAKLMPFWLFYETINDQTEKQLVISCFGMVRPPAIVAERPHLWQWLLFNGHIRYRFNMPLIK